MGGGEKRISMWVELGMWPTRKASSSMTARREWLSREHRREMNRRGLRPMTSALHFTWGRNYSSYLAPAFPDAWPTPQKSDFLNDTFSRVSGVQITHAPCPQPPTAVLLVLLGGQSLFPSCPSQLPLTAWLLALNKRFSRGPSNRDNLWAAGKG